MHISEMQKKNPEKVICFRDNGVQSCCRKFFILLQEYFSSEVNVLKSSLEISDHTKAQFFPHNLPRIHEKRA